MSAATKLPAPVAAPWAQLGAAVPALLLGFGIIGLLFWREIAAAVETWEASTAYNHCFLVLPIAAWMAWERRYRVAYMPIQPEMRAVWLVAPLVVGWFVADRIGIMEGRQLALIFMVEVLFLAVLGVRLFRLLSAPLLYLIFLVPFGAFLTPWLQDVTAWFTVSGLNLLGVLNYTDGLVIEIQGGTFVIAEACAGLRFLIASIAFGTLYACTIYRSPRRRLVFILVSIVVPVIANGFRALGIVLAGYWLGSAEAAAADHVIYGWVFFSFVTLLLIVIGLPFREDRGAEELPPAPPSGIFPPPRRMGMRVALAAGVLAATGPVLALTLDRVVQASPGPAPVAQLGPDCQAAPATPRRRAIVASVQEFICSSGRIRAVVAVFPVRANPGQIVAAQRQLSGETGADEADVTVVEPAQVGGMRWRMVEARNPNSLRATALWLDGHPASLGLRARIAQARITLVGGRFAPVLVAISPVIDMTDLSVTRRAQIRQSLATYLTDWRELSLQIAELSAAAAR